MSLRLFATAVAGLVVLLGGCGADPAPPAPSDPPPSSATPASVRMVTLTLTGSMMAGSADAAPTVAFTCMQGDQVGSCTLALQPGAIWSRKDQFPVGTMVRMSVKGGTRNTCWISDEMDRIVLVRDYSTGECSARAE